MLPTVQLQELVCTNFGFLIGVSLVRLLKDYVFFLYLWLIYMAIWCFSLLVYM